MSALLINYDYWKCLRDIGTEGREYLKMVEKTSNENRLTWRLPLYTVLIALIAFAVGGRHLVFPYIFAFVVISMLLLNDMIRKKRRRLLLTLVIYWAVSAVLVANVTTFHNAVRWLVLVAPSQSCCSCTIGACKGGFQAHRMGWMGNVCTEHRGVSCFRSDGFSFASGEEPSTGEVQRNTLRSPASASSGEPLVYRAVLYQ
jgi:hypothetical protein